MQSHCRRMSGLQANSLHTQTRVRLVTAAVCGSTPALRSDRGVGKWPARVGEAASTLDVDPSCGGADGFDAYRVQLCSVPTRRVYLQRKRRRESGRMLTGSVAFEPRDERQSARSRSAGCVSVTPADGQALRPWPCPRAPFTGSRWKGGPSSRWSGRIPYLLSRINVDLWGMASK